MQFLYFHKSRLSHGRAGGCALYTSDCQMERQVGVYLLHKAFHEHPWKGRWVCSLYIRLSIKEDGRAGLVLYNAACLNLYPNLGFQMERLVAAALMHPPQRHMEGQMGVVSIPQTFRWKGRWVCPPYTRSSTNTHGRVGGCALLTSGFQMERQVAGALTHSPPRHMERQMGIPSLHRDFHKHPWKGLWACSPYVRLSDGRAGADCNLLLSTLAILDVFTFCGRAAAS